MEDIINDLYEIIKRRKEEKEEGSYTCYLFEKGLDKILKKCGEECTEMVIAAKNHNNDELANEMCDFIYHMLVLMVENDLPIENVTKILAERKSKLNNLKVFHQTNKNT